MNTFLAALILTLVMAPGDPPTAVVSGDLVTISGDFAWFQDTAITGP